MGEEVDPSVPMMASDAEDAADEDPRGGEEMDAAEIDDEVAGGSSDEFETERPLRTAKSRAPQNLMHADRIQSRPTTAPLRTTAHGDTGAKQGSICMPGGLEWD